VITEVHRILPHNFALDEMYFKDSNDMLTESKRLYLISIFIIQQVLYYSYNSVVYFWIIKLMIKSTDEFVIVQYRL